MTDSQWALLAGFLLVAGTRMLDAFLPKGYMLKFITKWLVKNPTYKDDDDAPEEE